MVKIAPFAPVCMYTEEESALFFRNGNGVFFATDGHGWRGRGYGDDNVNGPATTESTESTGV
jgi:hypothetical protein